MVVNFVFLGDEPIENVITCLHYKVDKQICFGYHDTIEKRRESTKNFLTQYCGVKTVKFSKLSQDNLKSVLKTMRGEIEREREKGSKIFFDITGGERLLLLAFGMLATEFDAPMHMYDIPSDTLIELNKESPSRISRKAAQQNIKLNLDMYIKMRGGVINYELQKDVKEDNNPYFERDIEKLWNVSIRFPEIWNPLSNLCNTLSPSNSLKVNVSTPELREALEKSSNKLNSLEKLNQLVDALQSEGLLTDVHRDDKTYRFHYKNEHIRDCIWEGGSLLELHTYCAERKISDDCKVGVHLDWDGIINPGLDVLNEIDVLSLSGNIPTFISCKNGNLSKTKALFPLYELDTVAKRFGGKYAKKILIAPAGIGDIDMKRAAEMGIEVRK